LYPMPGGLVLHLALFDLEVDGVRLEGVGVVPDIEVERPIPYARGADPVLQRALEEIGNRRSLHQ
ncbi:MAG: S41 family peptidase, partial [Hyphomicrobiaceae bacterium]